MLEETFQLKGFSDDDVARFALVSKHEVGDPIWGAPAIVGRSQDGWLYVKSRRSGFYRCPADLGQMIANVRPVFKAILTTWITNRNLQGEGFPLVDGTALRRATSIKAMRFSTKIDRLFEFLDRVRYRPGDDLIDIPNYESSKIQFYMRVTECATPKEFDGIIAALVGEGLISPTEHHNLTSKGLIRLDATGAHAPNNDQAFVAMWFDASMEAAYDQGISPGLSDAGYRAFRVDRQEHANKIDDEIIAGIRRSRFLVADFTCGLTENGQAMARGGVYYEAGFAQGLQMPVIWCVRDDQVSQVHFDTRQFNHIVWNNAGDLRTKLGRRVTAVIGPPDAS